jgi:hypothetical protein
MSVTYETAIATLMGMFPTMDKEVIAMVLQVNRKQKQTNNKFIQINSIQM